MSLHECQAHEVIKLYHEHKISTAHKTKFLKTKMFLTFKLSDVLLIMLINVKNANYCWHFNIYEHDKFHAQFS